MSAISVIRLTGELEISRKDEIARALRIAGSEGGILVDFFDVTYADSTTLAELLRFRRDADQKGIPVAIIIGSRQFARLIQYAGLGDAFPVFDNRAAALTFLSSASPTA
jgi:anti-anti-sigma factor